MDNEKRCTVAVKRDTRERLAKIQRLLPVEGRAYSTMPTMDAVINWVIDNCSALPGQTKKAT